MSQKKQEDQAYIFLETPLLKTAKMIARWNIVKTVMVNQLNTRVEKVN